ncbi:hypothetical protein ACFQWF_24070 [Methylorubrum suomiense]
METVQHVDHEIGDRMPAILQQVGGLVEGRHLRDGRRAEHAFQKNLIRQFAGQAGYFGEPIREGLGSAIGCLRLSSTLRMRGQAKRHQHRLLTSAVRLALRQNLY